MPINEADRCRKYVEPKLYAAGWTEEQISEQKSFTDGRIVIAGLRPIDVHRKTVSYCVKIADGTIVDESKLRATHQALRQWAEKRREPCRGAMEATLVQRLDLRCAEYHTLRSCKWDTRQSNDQRESAHSRRITTNWTRARVRFPLTSPCHG
jgi:hypothetical protein